MTCYYIVRAWRHYLWTRSTTALKSIYPSLVKAALYLASRDTFGVGVPAAKNTTYWADWKDVRPPLNNLLSTTDQLLIKCSSCIGIPYCFDSLLLKVKTAWEQVQYVQNRT